MIDESSDGDCCVFLPDLCDLCGVVIADGGEVYGLVPDSSAVHAGRRGQDGLRLVCACSPGHLELLDEQYRQRPFVGEELWAGRIVRVMDGHPGGELSRGQLAYPAGLLPGQIAMAVAWFNARARERFGGGAEDSAP
ncbi:hypothetical protein [Streptomyces sp. NPDC002790]|uniref:hypothetical protein n=1 Tax=Streptomyces sp. NPDC002790 TaxID=3154431 RepID=UPI0033266CDF